MSNQKDYHVSWDIDLVADSPTDGRRYVSSVIQIRSRQSLTLLMRKEIPSASTSRQPPSLPRRSAHRWSTRSATRKTPSGIATNITTVGSGDP